MNNKEFSEAMGEKVFKTTFRIGAYLVDMRFDSQGLSSNWRPQMPSKLSTKQFERYRIFRNNFFAEVSEDLGIKAAVIDI